MSSPASPAPPLSIQGTLAALRWPTRRDFLFAVKAAIAAVLSLVIAFTQDLQNPYWAALTVYVLVSQPQTGAVRSKAFFRLAGTLIGGFGAILLAGVFGGDVGALLVTTIVAIVLATYAKALDRTPAGYTWFVIPLTLAVAALAQVQAPETVFSVATTRMVEIGLAILMIGLVDSIILPRALTPDFLRSMTDWRDRAAQWAAAALAGVAPQTPEAVRQRRTDLQRLAAFLGPLYGLSVQLPWDIGPTPPRGRDLRFTRLTLAHLIASLATADVWMEASWDTGDAAAGQDPLPGEVRDWLLERSAFEDPAVLDHAGRGEDLRDRLVERAAEAAAVGGADDLIRSTTLLRLSELVDHWSRLERTLHALATGTPLPLALRATARRARPAVSTDYVLALLDAAPLALTFGFLAALWFFTTWTSSISAMLFAFISLGFIGGTPGSVRSAQGIVLWIALSCALALLYQFVVLPRVTDFPVLIMVLLAAIVPLGLLMTMSPAGLLIVANGLALIALQNGYTGDYRATLENAFGAIVGCVVAAVALNLCQFDRARFTARRLARAQRQDLFDAASSWRPPDPDRLISLSVDRIALHTGAVAGLPETDPLRRDDGVETLQVAVDLLRLRQAQPLLTPVVKTHFEALRRMASAPGDARLDRPQLLAQLAQAVGAVLGEPASPPRTEALAALTGLQAVFSAGPGRHAAAGGGAS